MQNLRTFQMTVWIILASWLFCPDYPTTVKKASLTSDRNAVYVYCNLIRPQFISNAKVRILTVVAFNSITDGLLEKTPPTFV